MTHTHTRCVLHKHQNTYHIKPEHKCLVLLVFRVQSLKSSSHWSSELRPQTTRGRFLWRTRCHQPLSVCFQDYISEFKFKSVVAQDLIDFFLRYFPELQDAAVTQREGENVSAGVCMRRQPRHVNSQYLNILSMCTLWHGMVWSGPVHKYLDSDVIVLALY